LLVREGGTVTAPWPPPGQPGRLIGGLMQRVDDSNPSGAFAMIGSQRLDPIGNESICDTLWCASPGGLKNGVGMH
jgi:hypothetical protein